MLAELQGILRVGLSFYLLIHINNIEISYNMLNDQLLNAYKSDISIVALLDS